MEIRLTQRQKNVIKVLLFSQQAALNSLILLLSRAPSTDVQDFAEECLSAHILRQLKRVEKALENIGSEDFGICGICLKPISFERLMAMPTAVHCVQCAVDNERRQSQTLSRRNPIPRSFIVGL